MEIKTKYNIGDDVYFIHGNKIRHNKITRIDISIREERNKEVIIPRIEYTIDLGFRTGRISETSRIECDIYSTKEELIKSIVE